MDTRVVLNAKWLVFTAGLFGLTFFVPADTAGQEKTAPKQAPPAGAPVPPPANPVQEKAVPKAAVKAVPPAGFAAPPVDDAVRKQWEARFGPQIRLEQRMELHFMRLVTDPTKQQYEKIAADTEPTVKAAIERLVEGLAGGRGVQSDPHGPIADAIFESVRARLSREQVDRYRKEIDLRTAARKRLVVTNLVAMTDRVLILRPDQREKLAKVLAENWNESWNQTQILTYGGQYFPQMPDVKITPILTDAQRTVWRGISKANIHFGASFGFVQGAEIEDEVWDDDTPAKKPNRPQDTVDPKKPVPPKADGNP